MAAVSESNLAQQYQKKTDKEHILDNPDTYIGSVENVDTLSYIYDDTTNKIIQKEIQNIMDNPDYMVDRYGKSS